MDTRGGTGERVSELAEAEGVMVRMTGTDESGKRGSELRLSPRVAGDKVENKRAGVWRG